MRKFACVFALAAALFVAGSAKAQFIVGNGVFGSNVAVVNTGLGNPFFFNSFTPGFGFFGFNAFNPSITVVANRGFVNNRVVVANGFNRNVVVVRNRGTVVRVRR